MQNFKDWRPVRFCWNACKVIFYSSNRIGIWVTSLLASLFLPCLPVIIDWLKSGQIDKQNVVITTSILAATFIFTAEHTLCKAIYMIMFVAALLLDTVSGVFARALMEAYAGTLLAGVALLHSSERMWWHLVLNRPFPGTPRPT